MWRSVICFLQCYCCLACDPAAPLGKLSRFQVISHEQQTHRHVSMDQVSALCTTQAAGRSDPAAFNPCQPSSSCIQLLSAKCCISMAGLWSVTGALPITDSMPRPARTLCLWALCMTVPCSEQQLCTQPLSAAAHPDLMCRSAQQVAQMALTTTCSPANASLC